MVDTVTPERSVADIRLPRASKLPKSLVAAGFLANRRRLTHALRERHGSEFLIDLPMFGRTVFVSDPVLAKQLFRTSDEIVSNIDPNLGRVLGEGSIFNLEKSAHKNRRKLLAPPFHGKRMLDYEQIIEEEFRAEAATWPQDREFPILPSTMRVTLNAILRAVFGAEGEEFEGLRRVLPPFVELGSRFAVVPGLSRDLGRWSPGHRFIDYRAEFDALVESLVNKAKADPHLDERADVLSILLRARYDDGTAMTTRDLADELLTMLAAGHETTATTLAWLVERLRRHPAVWDRLVQENEAGEDELRRATIYETQRCRPVIDFAGRTVRAEVLELGPYRIPRGHKVIVGLDLIHTDDRVFPHAERFDPDRFVGQHPDLYSWVPFGGGVRRCIGAAFADMELNVVLRTLLTDFELLPTAARDERFHNRGVATAPHKGGMTRVRRRPSVS
jgi:cytochrome P450